MAHLRHLRKISLVQWSYFGVALILLCVPFASSAQQPLQPRPVFENPIIGVRSIPDLISRIIFFLLALAAPLTLLALIWGGFKYILAFGDEKKVGAAKQILMWSLIGLAIIILAFVIVSELSRVLGAQ